ncbi:hypothetical protein FOZ61_001921 [Perkinsus olseni]|uniref:Uncharacterized protein n=1 Tax=Perkinsus olseni TaxID=32597 RepID=A0A7J6LUY4_PEROL|nr:hypothetical protein FOZ61_001921 [Perkinsus olseni]
MTDIGRLGCSSSSHGKCTNTQHVHDCFYGYVIRWEQGRRFVKSNSASNSEAYHVQVPLLPQPPLLLPLPP